MCRREYDARIALMMLTEGRAGNSNNPTSSPTPTVESRPPAVQLMKLLDDRSSTDAAEAAAAAAVGGAGRNDGWRFLLEDPKRPQVCMRMSSRRYPHISLDYVHSLISLWSRTLVKLACFTDCQPGSKE